MTLSCRGGALSGVRHQLALCTSKPCVTVFGVPVTRTRQPPMSLSPPRSSSKFRSPVGPGGGVPVAYIPDPARLGALSATVLMVSHWASCVMMIDLNLNLKADGGQCVPRHWHSTPNATFSDFGNFAESVCKWRLHSHVSRCGRSEARRRADHNMRQMNARPLRTNLRTRGEDPAHPRVCAVADDEGNAQLIATR